MILKKGKLCWLLLWILVGSGAALWLQEQNAGTLWLEMETSPTSNVQVFFSTPQGYQERNSVFFATKEGDIQQYAVPMRHGVYSSLRVDPLTMPGYFAIRSISFQGYGGSWKWSGDELAAHLRVGSQVELLGMKNGAWQGKSTGNDPSLEVVDFPASKVLMFRDKLKIAACGGLTAALIWGIIVFAGSPAGLWKRLFSQMGAGKTISWRKWCYGHGGFILAALLSVACINLLLDPFGVFKSSVFPQSFQLNERFRKVDFLMSNATPFDTYLFGSSRIGVVDPCVYEKLLPGASVYNFSVSSASVADIRNQLVFLSQQPWPLRLVVVQIDLENMMVSKNEESDYLRKAHPLLRHESPWKYYLEYALIQPTENWQGKWENNYKPLEKRKYDWVYDVERSGRTWPNGKQQRIEEEGDRYWETEPTLQKNVRVRAIRIRERQWQENLQALQEIRELCTAKGIRLLVAVTPQSPQLTNLVVTEDYMRFLEDLTKITSYWNFSGYNSVTLERRNYYEFSHYRPHVGEWMALRMLGGSQEKVPADFGAWVSQETWPKHSQEMRWQFEQMDRQLWER